MGVFKPLLGCPDLMIQLILDISLDFFQISLREGSLAIFDDLNLKFLGRTAFKAQVLPRLSGIYITIWFTKVRSLILHGDEICHRLLVLVIDPEDLLSSGIGDLLNRLGDLDLRNLYTVVLNFGNLINCTKDRVGLCRDHAFTDSEAVKAAALRNDRRNRIFIQAV